VDDYFTAEATLRVAGAYDRNEMVATAAFIINNKDENREMVYRLEGCGDEQARFMAIWYGLKWAYGAGVETLEVLGHDAFMMRVMMGDIRLKPRGLRVIYDEIKKLEYKIGKVRYELIRKESNMRCYNLATLKTPTGNTYRGEVIRPKEVIQETQTSMFDLDKS